MTKYQLHSMDNIAYLCENITRGDSHGCTRKEILPANRQQN